MTLRPAIMADLDRPGQDGLQPETPAMLARLFPRQFDNAYAGSRIAAWILGVLLLLKGVMGFNAMVFTRMVAGGVDRIPLDSYGPSGARMVLVFFSLWGLWQLLVSLLGVLVLIRYRAMIPLILLLLTLEQFGRKGLFLLHPDPAAPAAAAAGFSTAFLINAGFSVALVAALVLSLMRRRSGGAAAAG
jgi:hypothetical protein